MENPKEYQYLDSTVKSLTGLGSDNRYYVKVSQTCERALKLEFNTQLTSTQQELANLPLADLRIVRSIFTRLNLSAV